MPHIVVNVWPGRSDEEKKTLANRIALDVADTFGNGYGICLGLL